MTGKRRMRGCSPSVTGSTTRQYNRISIFLTCCWCFSLFSAVVVSESTNINSVSTRSFVSRTLAPTASLLRWRAGAFGSSKDDTTTTENDSREKRESGRKGEKKSTNKTNGKQRSDNDATVEEYVAAMRERDACQDPSVTGPTKDNNDNAVAIEEAEEDASSSYQGEGESSTNRSSKASLKKQENGSSPVGNKEPSPSVVGVKSHKKSNAVGDPDGDDDDDDDDEEETEESEYSEEWEEIEESYHGYSDGIFEPQVEVEVEMVEENVGLVDHHNEKDRNNGDSLSSPSRIVASKSGGGVGVRLGRIGNRRKNNRQKKLSSSAVLKQAPLSYDHARLQAAWNPFVYFPPSPSALAFLSDNARLLDASSKNRLDRRTLYAGLLLEWGATESKLSSSTRKFLPTSSSQALQAALSLATQPVWRQSAPRTNGIRLYQDNEKNNAKGSTLGMQETIAMALAHSLGCGMLILDDHVINKVRHQMANCGLSEGAMKPAALIKSLLSLATEGKLREGENSGSISACMKRDLLLGLDDPYDERAVISCDDMSSWEKEWKKDLLKSDDDESSSSTTVASESDKPLPLLIFIRTNTSTNLLKSKSAMELLIHECASNESIHLVTLGKGIDATTLSLPKEEFEESQEYRENSPADMANSKPFFAFSNQHQNASGRNDPEGSQRFNIFLSRTQDQNGQPGIVGAIATPQAGNLFPHMMAIQARERLQNEEEDSPERAELEKLEHWLSENSEHLSSMPPPQFFNASLGYPAVEDDGSNNDIDPMSMPSSPQVVQQVLQDTMTELLDRMAEISDDTMPNHNDISPDVKKAFAQVLGSENLRRGIADNLARAAPALSDPKCQGVMLSVYVPPPAHHANQGQMPAMPNNGMQQQGRHPPNNMGGWFQKILSNQEEKSMEDNNSSNNNSIDEDSNQKNKQKRVRTLAAAAAVMAANKANKAKGKEKSSENKAGRNLAKLEQICRPIPVGLPQDPVRAKSWDYWVGRERGAVIFRQNRKLLNEELATRNLAIQQHTGTHGAGSALRQMLSVRDISSDVEDVVKCAVELEAAKSLRQGESSQQMHEKEMGLDVDISLSQLMVSEDGSIETKETTSIHEVSHDALSIQYIHPSSLETALSMKCQLSPSPSGGLSLSNAQASHRTKDEIMALAQDKHERALVSQVVSPQDIGVTYDMVGGLSNVKELLRQSITYPLKFPQLYSEGIAREAVKGVLLFGPPGTGKTMLAKAVATEGGASFLSVDASSVENKWLGESEKNAKAVFTLARRLAPCVVFIDEVDSLLSSREGSSDDSAHGTLTSVKTTMMSEWDGLNSGTNGSGDRVVVIGSTNRPFDLDEAVLRRFPRRILVDLPDLETRTEILEVTLAENRLDPAVNLTQIAERLEGYTGSDIKEVCREAVVQISHEQARLLDQGFVNSREDVTEGSLQRLRPVTVDDFETALSKLKRSVSEKGRELARVWEWNDEYGEIKKEKPNNLPQLMNMYL